MARCNSCSAPLQANTNRCIYCGTRNDIDLHGKYNYSIEQTVSQRICPHCDQPLQTICLNKRDALVIERCPACYGLFFDPGEIETLLENSVSNVFDINLKHIQNINKDRHHKNQKFKYIKCPECRILMNRSNFGHRSGVIVDSCKSHGMWLDNGEITHLLEWKKAGGQMLHNKQQQKIKKNSPYSSASNRNTITTGSPNSQSVDGNLVESIATLMFKIFT